MLSFLFLVLRLLGSYFISLSYLTLSLYLYPGLRQLIKHVRAGILKEVEHILEACRSLTIGVGNAVGVSIFAAEISHAEYLFILFRRTRMPMQRRDIVVVHPYDKVEILKVVGAYLAAPVREPVSAPSPVLPHAVVGHITGMTAIESA